MDSLHFTKREGFSGLATFECLVSTFCCAYLTYVNPLTPPKAKSENWCWQTKKLRARKVKQIIQDHMVSMWQYYP